MAAARAIDEQLSRLVIPDVDGVRRSHIAFIVKYQVLLYSKNVKCYS